MSKKVILENSQGEFLFPINPDYLNKEQIVAVLKEHLLDFIPLGFIVASTQNVSPASEWGGVWEALPEGCAFWTTQSNGGQIIAPGLPNIMARFSAKTYSDAQDSNGAMKVVWWDSKVTPSGTSKDKNIWHVFSASDGECGTFTDTSAVGPDKFNVPTKNVVYGKSDTVQPKSFTMFAWRRVA